MTDNIIDSRWKAAKVLVDGPIAGTYSLAIVNRRFAVSLLDLGLDVYVTQREGPDPLMDPYFLAESELADRYIQYDEISGLRFDVHTKNDWPMSPLPRCAPLLTAHCYAWEESLFPTPVISQLDGFDAIFCTSRYTIEALDCSGYTGTTFYMGNGVDHLAATPFPKFKSGTKNGAAVNFLHISSGLARKGVSDGLAAFINEFSEADDVYLTLKTHHNPYNEIYQCVEHIPNSLKSRIKLDDSDLSSEEICKLIEDADCCFLPSKGEGFLLPAAEAMLLGTLVCSTYAGGNREFCTPETCVLIPTAFAPSRSIISNGKSAWLEATHADIRAGLRKAYEICKGSDRSIHSAAHNAVRSFTWNRAAKLFLDGLEALSFRNRSGGPSMAKGKICLISTFNQQCGIATYTAALYDHARSDPRIDLTVYSELLSVEKDQHDGHDVTRVWDRTARGIDRLIGHLLDNESGASFIIQHHPGIIGWKDLTRLCKALLPRSKSVSVEIHSTDGNRKEIANFFRTIGDQGKVVVHNISDYFVFVNGLRSANNVYLFPHPAPDRTAQPSLIGDGYNIFSYGLCSPHKNFQHLFNITRELRARNKSVKTNIITAVNPNSPESIHYSNYLYNLRDSLGLRDVVTLNFDFVPADSLVEAAREANVAIFCYADVNEGASGAVRIPLSCGLPTITSLSPIFADLAGICEQVTTSNEIKTSDLIEKLVEDEYIRRSIIEKQSNFVSFTSWQKHWTRLSKLI